jgi:hypothetical protein
MGSIESPFSPTGLQPAIAERDQRIGVLEYQLRCTTADLEARERERIAAVVASSDCQRSGSSWLASWLGTDEDGQPVTRHERRTLNALVRRYLLARGYKATCASFAEEIGGPSVLGASSLDAALAEAELELIALPRTQGVSGTGRSVLSLLGMHRKRIAPIQQLAELEARNDSTISALRSEITALQGQLELVGAELASTKDHVAQV